MQLDYMKSLESVGFDLNANDVVFVEDNWENPTIGASGVGWEVRSNGMEISQFTYMQQIGGVKMPHTACELTYGLERLVMQIQDVDSVFDISWSSSKTYGDIYRNHEMELGSLCTSGYDSKSLSERFSKAELSCNKMLGRNSPVAAYYCCLNAVDAFNLLEAQGEISYHERAGYVSRTRKMAQRCCEVWIAKYEEEACSNA